MSEYAVTVDEEWLRNIGLVCPVDKTPVVLHDGGKSLKCPECRRVYAILDGIPKMIIEEATIEG